MRRIGWPTPSADPYWLAKQRDPTWQIIPVMPAGSDPKRHLPVPWQAINAAYWSHHPAEIVWAIFQRCGLSAEESKVFISYVRRDSTPIADQLFENLTAAGFDVFLDRCCIPMGVTFQSRLIQDICDKAMVVLINSANVANSSWVEDEIATVKAYRLGLLELRLPGGRKRDDIDPDLTHIIHSADLMSAGPPHPSGSQMLMPSALNTALDRIKTTHGRALHRRRNQLIDDFAAALTQAGKSARATPSGAFLVQSGVKEAVVGVTVRPPELSDFCAFHTQGGICAARNGWLISPAPFFMQQRKGHVEWLGGVCNIQHVNEAHILQLANAL
jgi:hypothetical protein